MITTEQELQQLPSYMCNVIYVCLFVLGGNIVGLVIGWPAVA